ncbi:glycosyltransferase [Bacillus sp. S3]|uniref:glycosyltransferase n=1 Tax=Bacillus sp. S3 TaxID=486398 RepID=UPI001681B30F|nr:glycosyltransferase [Bacillus sp. S3]
MNYLVSIIVPIYNVENYLSRCIDSLLNQTYKKVEVILINDGSIDNSGTICDKYAFEDSRIKVIHRENGGLSEARNTGILNATGDYILFVDSDDYIEPNSIEVLISHAIKYDLDVLEANAIIEYPQKIEKLVQTRISTTEIFTGLDYIVKRINENYITAVACIKFCKLKFIKDNNLLFAKNRLHEDELWTPCLFLAAARVMFIDFEFYHYIIRENSITQSKNKKMNIESMLNNCIELEKLYNSLDIEKSEKSVLKDYLARQYMATAFLGKDDMSFYKQCIDKKFVLRNTKKLKTMFKSVLYIISIPMYIKVRENSY